MYEARYLRRGTLVFISVALIMVGLWAVKVGAGNMIGVPGNAFSLALIAGFLISVAMLNKKW